MFESIKNTITNQIDCLLRQIIKPNSNKPFTFLVIHKFIIYIFYKHHNLYIIYKHHESRNTRKVRRFP